MAILRDEDREHIRKQLDEGIAAEVTLTLVGPSALTPPARDLTPQIRELYGEIAALSPKVKLEWVEVPTAAQREAFAMEPGEGGPVTLIAGPAGKGKVRYLGAPAGHEFPNLLHALVAASHGGSELSEASRTAIARIERPTRIRVFFTPT
jgi:alkyl hydroperoxide reductase subunit AhpF